jgi:hypothetical protein
VSGACLLLSLLIGWYIVFESDLLIRNDIFDPAYYVLLAVLGLSVAGFLFGVMRSYATFTGQRFGGLLEMGGPAVGAFLTIAGGISVMPTQSQFDMTVRFQGAGGLKGVPTSGFVIVDIEGRRDREPIDGYGQASIKAIPARLQNKKFSIFSLEALGFRLQDGSSLYSVEPGGVINVPVIVDKASSQSSDPATFAKTSDGWSLGNCLQQSQFALDEFRTDVSATSRVPDLIACKQPTGFSIGGSAKFYKGDYFGAESDFEQALQHLPESETITQARWLDNLADAQIETSKYVDAINNLNGEIKITPGDEHRWDLARAYLYKGQQDPSAYTTAIEILQGIDPNTGSPVQKGKVQIVYAAALVGKSHQMGLSPTVREETVTTARRTLCAGIEKNEDFWRSILAGKKPYVNASLREEIHLLKEIDGASIACAT